MSAQEGAQWKRLKSHLGGDAAQLMALRVDGKVLAASRGRINLRFRPGTTTEHKDALASRVGTVSRDVIPHVAESWNVGEAVADALEVLSKDSAVEFAEPELALPMRRRSLPNDPFFPRQWHLHSTGQEGALTTADVNAPEAWEITRGSPDTVIAIIDDGVDRNHEDLDPCRLILGPDVWGRDNEPFPGTFDGHGTSCAGVAAASSDNNVGVAGACPQCRIMAIRLFGGADTLEEATNYYDLLVFDSLVAQAFVAAVDGGADILSNSWGPGDRVGLKLMPSVVKAAFDYALTQGRNGLGAVVVFAAGNGDEEVYTDGYATYPGVVSVAASSDHNKRVSYSDFGEQITVCAPTLEWKEEGATTTGIWTTDVTGAMGYNPGDAHAGDRRGNYSNSFGGTSSACPLVAGTLGLMLSANPQLTREQAVALLTSTAVKIDPENGAYNEHGHSRFYGYGKIDAAAAVQAVMANRTVPVVGVTCGSGCGELVCIPDERFDDYCTKPCATAGECPTGYSCQSHALVSGSTSQVCVRETTCLANVEICGDHIDNDGDQLADEDCAVPCTEETILGRCDGNTWFACEHGTNLQGECPPESQCVVDPRGFAVCQGCGDVTSPRCVGNDVVYCADNYLAGLSCPEACGVDPYWGATCFCAHGSADNKCLDTNTLALCAGARTYQVTCPHGCGQDPLYQMDICLCEGNVGMDPSCQDNKLVSCNGSNGQVSSVTCPFGCQGNRCLCEGGIATEWACLNNKLVECDGLSGYSVEHSCEFGCDPTGEKPHCACAPEVANGPTCDGNRILKCNPMTGKVDTQECPYGCVSTGYDVRCACAPQVADGGVCEGNTVIKCDNTTGEPVQTQCPGTCDYDTYGYPGCTCSGLPDGGPGCVGDDYVYCNTENGQQQVQTCQYGCGPVPYYGERCLCRTGAAMLYECNGDVLQMCYYGYEYPSVCPFGCDMDYRGAAACNCADSTLKGTCDGDQLTYCADNETMTVTCPNGCMVDDQGFARCTPTCQWDPIYDEYYCQGDQIIQCDRSGAGIDMLYCTYSGQKCLMTNNGPRCVSMDTDGGVVTFDGGTNDGGSLPYDAGWFRFDAGTHDAGHAMDGSVHARDASVMTQDGGVMHPDAGMLVDSGMGCTDGCVVVDSGVMAPDAAVVIVDSGVVVVDSGVVVVDSGVVEPDAGVVVVDSGTPHEDAGVTVADASVVKDASAIADASPVTTDAGNPTRDASVPPPDAGTVDSGSAASADAGTSPDAGASPSSSSSGPSGDDDDDDDDDDDGPCSCTTTRGTPDSAWLLLGLLGLAWVTRAGSRRR